MILFLDAEREGYAPDQIKDTMTVGELQSYLDQFDEDEKIFLRHDRGYTYGGITQYDFEEYDEEEDSEDLFSSRKLTNAALKSNLQNVFTQDEVLDKVKAKVQEVLTGPDFGFDESEVDAYSAVELRPSEWDSDYIEVEVRAEVTYGGLMKLCDALNPIVEQYDKDSYFEPATSGIISAQIKVK